ncbi:flavin reductase family protein [Streptomyces sp. NPDC020983]|uniref:flavin reductase family protein n=1 Tax=Streptomyces sp. NPDC020983 TaxID=3365106 RepID=UPI00379E343D
MTTHRTSADLVAAPDQEHFREVLGHFASGVIAVTGTAPDGGPAGLTVSSFTSVSLEPPLLSFCVAHTSRSWPRLRASKGVCVNILSDGQQDVATRLARSDERKFEGLRLSSSPGGLPVLDGALAWLEGAVVAEHPAGDHDIVVVQVHRLAAAGRLGPLLRFRGAFERLAERREGA